MVRITRRRVHARGVKVSRAAAAVHGIPGRNGFAPPTPWTSRSAVPADAAPTQPYFLASPREGDKYGWTVPHRKACLRRRAARRWIRHGGRRHAAHGATRVDFDSRPRSGRDPPQRQRRPAVTVAVDSPLAIVPIGTSSGHRIDVTTMGHGVDGRDGTVRLELRPVGRHSRPSAPLR